MIMFWRNMNCLEVQGQIKLIIKRIGLRLTLGIAELVDIRYAELVTDSTYPRLLVYPYTRLPGIPGLFPAKWGSVYNRIDKNQ
jgi:hypothetical protein